MHIKKSGYFRQHVSLPNMWHFNQEAREIIGLYSRNKKFFHSGHMHGVHRNACLTYLFIASNSLVVWAGRHKDISKHKPRPAKSWVVRLISKTRQCRSQRPNSGNHTATPSSPPGDSRRSRCVRLFEHQFLWARVLVTSQCLSLWWLCANKPVSEVTATC